MYYIFQTMNKRIRLISLIFSLFIVWGCVSIPKEPYVRSSREKAASVSTPPACEDVRFEEVLQTIPEQPAGLNPKGFTLLNWNMMKGNRAGWEDDFKRLSNNADLVTVQEARLAAPLPRLLQDNAYSWDLTTAFLSNNKEVGVLNGSRVKPLFLCTINYSEPLFIVPKTILLSLYPLRDSDQMLLVANVHLINFTFDSVVYNNQLHKLEKFLAQHEGPLLVTGDFNTWSDDRLGLLRNFAGRLNLNKVAFARNTMTTFLGNIVDHVLYRGIEPTDAQAIKVLTSDHNPLLVTFRLAE
jgi:endonuclease/exonuclease/phosphatase (EEP) superfamily protein YafD